MKRRRYARASLKEHADALLELNADSVPSVDVAPVGWMYPGVLFVGVRGEGHLCIVCQPAPLVGMIAVYRAQLAATERCRLCGRRLDEIVP